MEVYLVSHFLQVGAGIPDYSLALYNALKNKANVHAIDLYSNKSSKYGRFSVARRLLREKLFFILNYRLFKDKNVHVLAPDLFPIGLLKYPRRKIVSVYDTYAFDRYMQKKINKMPLPRKIFHNLVRKRTQKAYKNLWKYDKILVFDQELKDFLVQHLRIDRDKIEIVPAILSNKYYKEEHKLRKTGGKIVIGYINSFSLNKIENLKIFIKIFKRIKDDKLEFRIYGGNFPLKNEIMDDTRIKYAGFLPENKMVRTIQDFDVFLSTDKLAGYGLHIMKAKALRVPVLCYDGKLISIVKRNTLLWNKSNLERIIKTRRWKKIDKETAYEDVANLRPSAVANKILSIYTETFK